ncbi:MAG: hypothetical protein AUH29_05005 [Candidatus Rokubacteria bacterium 13_1_40CM_69_27]|nr:MAG: hypothetical protein AUH29_05005 [Candidatus Rokubacteria bacterium 13_1_40CM_69_27]OLC33408.1 MAG: hypothetical protein AUH81_14310 [Candidatus Rokubacteria bacterium 13_1_40CM_4_69_5]
MLAREDAHRLLLRVLSEFVPEWELVGEVAEVTIRDPEHWLSGIGTFGVTLRHRHSGALKVLGRRAGLGGDATYHRGISFLVLEAYADRNTDPIRRYLQEVGVAPFQPHPLSIFKAS